MVAADAPIEPTAAESHVMDSVGAGSDQRQRGARRRPESEINRPGRLDHASMTLRSHPGSYAARAVRGTFLSAQPRTREEHLMFSPHDTSAIHVHERIDRLHHDARVASSLSSLDTSYRIRIASVVRRLSTWIEPQRAAVRVSAIAPTTGRIRLNGASCETHPGDAVLVPGASTWDIEGQRRLSCTEA